MILFVGFSHVQLNISNECLHEEMIEEREKRVGISERFISTEETPVIWHSKERPRLFGNVRRCCA